MIAKQRPPLSPRSCLRVAGAICEAPPISCVVPVTFLVGPLTPAGILRGSPPRTRCPSRVTLGGLELLAAGAVAQNAKRQREYRAKEAEEKKKRADKSKRPVKRTKAEMD